MAIHAGREWNLRMCRQCYQDPFFTALSAAGIRFPSSLSTSKGGSYLPHLGLAFGAVVAVAELVECWPTEMFAYAATVDSLPVHLIIGLETRALGDFHPGRYAWEYRNVKRLNRPIPVRGRQGLFELDEERSRMVEDAIPLTERKP
jgi:hypothetical protein